LFEENDECKHTTLAHPKATEAQLEAIHAAIATWSEVLDDCSVEAITLTDVTGTLKSEQKAANIVVHYVPTAGGVVFARNGLARRRRARPLLK